MRLKKRIVALTLALSVTIGGATPIIPANNVTAKTRKVYYAPYMGKKYHCTKTCRGLNRAREIRKISVKGAKKLHLTKCKICY